MRGHLLGEHVNAQRNWPLMPGGRPSEGPFKRGSTVYISQYLISRCYRRPVDPEPDRYTPSTGSDVALKKTKLWFADLMYTNITIIIEHLYIS